MWPSVYSTLATLIPKSDCLFIPRCAEPRIGSNPVVRSEPGRRAKDRTMRRCFSRLDVIMPIHVNDIETLHDFAMGIMARAGHRTNQVRGIALATLGGIIWRVDPGSIEIRFQDGGGANLLRWVSVTGYEYTCAYNQKTDEIEIHDRKRGG